MVAARMLRVVVAVTSGQLHIVHRDAYLRGRRNGNSDALADRDYRPRDAATGTEDEQRAYRLGYEDGFTSATEPVS
jgi:hypothetical protein